jgi:hypothetical protein
MILLPPNILECHPDSCYEFESQDELRKNIVYANQKEILYIHFTETSRNFTLRTILLILSHAIYGAFDIVHDYVLFSGQVCKRTLDLQHRR